MERYDRRAEERVENDSSGDDKKKTPSVRKIEDCDEYAHPPWKSEEADDKGRHEKEFFHRLVQGRYYFYKIQIRKRNRGTNRDGLR